MLLDNKTITKALDEAVTEKGEDYIYVSPLGDGEGDCFYATPDGAPSCIVGHVVAKLDPEGFQSLFRHEWEGVNLETAPYDEDGFYNEDYVSPSSMGFEAATDYLSADFEDESVVLALRFAQGVQDGGGSWGDAKRAYEAALAHPQEALTYRYDIEAFIARFVNQED